MSNCKKYDLNHKYDSIFNMKNVLILGATSDMADLVLNYLVENQVNVYAISRSKLEFESDLIHKFNADLSIESEINRVFGEINDVKFDAVINFQGVAISAPVEFLSISDLTYQYQVSVFSLVSVLKNLRGRLIQNAKVISISSMASFGMFPFLAPYETAKASADIILNCYEMETGVKTVSIKPGVVKTKFWQASIDLNKDNFANFPFEYEKIGKFLQLNAKRNENRGISANDVSKLIIKILNKKNPKASYTIGKDAKLMEVLSHFKSRSLFSIIRRTLKKRAGV